MAVMTTAATPAELDPTLSPEGVVLAVRLQLLEMMGELAVLGLRRLLGMMLGVTGQILAQADRGRDIRPEERLGTHVAAGVWRFARLLRIARWCVMLAARIEANPQLCLTWPAPIPARARAAARRAPLPVETPAGYARLLARLRRMLPLGRNPTRDEARALEQALARRGIVAIIVGFCRDLRIEIAPYAGLFAPRRKDGIPLPELLPGIVSIRDWLAREVAREKAKPMPDGDTSLDATTVGAVPASRPDTS